MSEIVETVVGLVLVAIIARDVVHELFHPAGTGTLSRWLRKRVWRAFHAYARGRPKRLRMAGPAALLTTITAWSVIATVGWALVYLPYLPEHFRFASPLVPALNEGFGTALYLSLLSLSTVGLGDITPTHFLLRVAFNLEAFLGISLLTAGINWALSIKPVLAQRRSLAASIHGLIDAERRAAVALDQLPPDALRSMFAELARALTRVRAGLMQSPASYYFHAESGDVSLPGALPYLLARTRTVATTTDDVALRYQTAALESALDGLATTVSDQFLSVQDAGTERILDAYAADHLQSDHGDST